MFTTTSLDKMHKVETIELVSNGRTYAIFKPPQSDH